MKLMMKHARDLLLAVGVATALGCASTPVIPELPSAEAHRAVAKAHMEKAAELEKKYDPTASVQVGGRVNNYTGDSVPVLKNPTARYRVEAKQHSKKAELHLKAAEEFED